LTNKRWQLGTIGQLPAAVSTLNFGFDAGLLHFEQLLEALLTYRKTKIGLVFGSVGQHDFQKSGNPG